MRPSTRIGLVATVCSLMLWPAGASAQQRCPEGETASGECVNPLLAGAMRQIGIIFAQPKISQTTYPVLPADDRMSRYPNQLIPDPLKPAPTAGPPVPQAITTLRRLGHRGPEFMLAKRSALFCDWKGTHANSRFLKDHDAAAL
jgi:hypothetical protein